MEDTNTGVGNRLGSSHRPRNSTNNHWESTNSSREGEDCTHRYRPSIPRNGERRSLASQPTSIQQQHHNRRQRQRDNYGYDRYPTRNTNAMQNYRERGHNDSSGTNYNTHSSRNSGSYLPRWNGQMQSELRSNTSHVPQCYNTLPGEDTMLEPCSNSRRFQTRSNCNSTNEGEGRSHWSRQHGGRYHPRRFMPRNDERRSLASRSNSVQQNQHNNQNRRHRDEITEIRNQRRRHNDSYNPDYSLPHRNEQSQSEMSNDYNYGPEVYNTHPGEEIMPDSSASQNIQDPLQFTDIEQRLSANEDWSDSPHIDDSAPPSPANSEPSSPVEHHDYLQISVSFSSRVQETPGDNQTNGLHESVSRQSLPSAALILLIAEAVLAFTPSDDNETYEDNLALGEQMGVVERGLHEETITEHLKTREYTSADRKIPAQETEICVVCQDEYKDQEMIGKLDCGHEYHAGCIRKWLLTKNECPVCKQEALKI